MVTGRSWSAERPSGRVTDADPIDAGTPSSGRDATIVPVRSELRTVRTGGTAVVVDLTGECEEFVGSEGDGLLHVFVPHATAGLAVIETGSGSDDDLLAQLDELLPRDDRWRHRHGSPGHGRDHVLPAFLPPHLSVPVLEGRLQLGTWQRICLVDPNLDNPRRQVRLSFLRG
ncbi:YjbQ family protein [Geodermatophilus normandii]|uniref:YjbQ family protein n=1 Tax=Geodermatophilus normandii TaxID=1137989 RepID=A0A6P0GGB2_9ACTN|nr:YjbQ family protein [Geodermatophilus normandii]